MLDFEFEEIPSFNAFLPKQFTAPAYSYTLVLLLHSCFLYLIIVFFSLLLTQFLYLSLCL